MLKLIRFVTFAFVMGLAVVCPVPLHAWSEGGHHLIASIAFGLLTPEEQTKLLAILGKHPRYSEDFMTPDKLPDQREIDRWLVGRAGYWPDVARRQPEYHRSTWHYELGSSATIGNSSGIPVPDRPGPLPADADLQTKDLYIAQALELSKKVMGDKTRSDTDRAIALCWIGHLVADAHQPCHAGSLYMEKVFEEKDGDRGANRILTKQRGNMHALWDGLLGADWSLRGTRRRMVEITQDAELVRLGEQAAANTNELNPQKWLAESRQLAVEHVYTPEVMESLQLVARGVVSEPQEIELSEAYLQNAGRVSQRRAIQAAYRLAEVWREAIKA
jgi:hypothetical protein